MVDVVEAKAECRMGAVVSRTWFQGKVSEAEKRGLM